MSNEIRNLALQLNDDALRVAIEDLYAITRERSNTPNDAELDLWDEGQITAAVTTFNARSLTVSIVAVPQRLHDASKERKMRRALEAAPVLTTSTIDDSIPF